jgi:adenosylcobinamide-GDP ribazoletransferase
MDMTKLKDEAPSFFLALQFLTRLPWPADVSYSEVAMQRSPGWYPAVGLVIGGLSAVIFLAAALVLPHLMAVLITVSAGLLLTGALHEDGFADLCDGLGGARGARSRALEIMRDSRIGAYGAIGLGMALALRIAALMLLPPWAVPVAVIVGAVVSRASMTRAMAVSIYVRALGAGSAMAGEMPDSVLQRALLTGAVLMVISWPVFGLWAGIGGAIGVTAAHLGLRKIYEPRLGGYTGDCLGAVQIVTEIGFLVGLLAGM